MAVLHANGTSLEDRLNFMGLDTATRTKLRELKPTLASNLGPALTEFYEKVRNTPQTARFFSSDTHMAGAKGRQEAHWNVIADANYGPDYEAAVKRIGQTHARLGLEPTWYIGGYALVFERLIQAVVKEQWPGLFSRRTAPEAMSASLSALMKAVLLDMDLAISTYLDAQEEQRQKAEAERLEAERRQQQAVTAITAALRQVASGDMSTRLTEDLAPEFAQLKADFNDAIVALSGTLVQVADSADSIGSSSAEIGHAADDLAQRTEHQAMRLEQTAAALNQLTVSVKRAAEGASQAAAKVVSTRDEAKHSGEIVSSAVRAISEIAKSSQEISQIIGVIDEIAFQTNLLALNAGVEAARAGEAGRGFAVVASEVRALAQRSAEAAKQIKGLISTSSAQVDQGVKLMAETGEVSERIISSVIEIDELVASIASSSREQSIGLSDINTAVSEMDQGTQQNAAMVEQTTAAVHSLRSEASALAENVSAFMLGDSQKKNRRVEKPVRAPAYTPAATRPAFHSQGAAAYSIAPDTNDWEEF
ncbi:globin-coupled sensor protein [Aquamicrobium zhengzhouense]|uniref:Globin-coupled sensor protein n=1 Tax=Aquamicrobium zhengzhouense TaxID=2781738 RepID=A0ABS0SG01_9HYPH|nr:globin-coupled sensor protein [Aquamicrobium zhengzhouense]MBI1622234.1 globin-coupled sensor protein [Aquamicrobium zhengzhouense]